MAATRASGGTLNMPAMLRSTSASCSTSPRPASAQTRKEAPKLGDQLQDLPLPRRQAVLWIGLTALFRLLLAGRGAQCGADVDLAVFDGAQCSLELGHRARYRIFRAIHPGVMVITPDYPFIRKNIPFDHCNHIITGNQFPVKLQFQVYG
jgi:hypothetical protein